MIFFNIYSGTMIYGHYIVCDMIFGYSTIGKNINATILLSVCREFNELPPHFDGRKNQQKKCVHFIFQQEICCPGVFK